MIFARDKGRLCNNILQYGHVYAWAREHGRRCVSMRFCYKYDYFSICGTRYHNFLTYITVKYLAKLGLMPIVGFHDEGEDTAAKEREMLRRRNVVVEGWYVRFYDLFLKYKGEIINLFAFKSDILSKTKAYIDENTADGKKINLGVHIRRGDYKTWKDGRFYFDDDTYIGYIRQFAELHPGSNINVFICGNDPTLDKDKYAGSLQGMNVRFPAGNPGEDLCLLSECDFIMGAPSTFSLVAAMYHDRPLCWLYDKGRTLSQSDFKRFDYLFKHIE